MTEQLPIDEEKQKRIQKIMEELRAKGYGGPPIAVPFKPTKKKSMKGARK